jgi:hypothetical protein
VLEPIPTIGLTGADVDALTRKVEDLMRSEVTALTEKWWAEIGYKPPTAKELATEPATNGKAKSTAVEPVAL